MNAILKKAIDILNPRQREAVEIISGPLLIVAGAGSGKTRALTVRIANLIENHRVEPSSILAVTFTNKAAGQMKERVADLVPGSSKSVTITTFHSFCCMLLRKWSDRAGFENGFTIFDDEDQEKLLNKVVQEMNLDKKVFSPKILTALISQAKNDLVFPKDFLPPHPAATKIQAIYERYQNSLKANAAVDFDDLIFLVYYLLADNSDLLEKVQRRYRYFLVDEYQDTNNAQYRLISLISRESGNLCVVGDEDQSIYGWRGASIRNILEFEKDFPGARVVILDQNYRSTQNILDAASRVISNNSGCRKKHLWTDRKGGDLLVLHRADDDREEAEYVVREIESLHGMGRKYSDFSTLFRMNSLTRSLEQSLVRNGIPYEVTGGTKFYHRREVKDILAYLRVLANERDSVALRRIINTPRRGIGDSTVSKLEARGALWPELEADSRKNPTSKIARFHELIVSLKEVSLSESLSYLVNRIIEDTEYLDYLHESDPESAEDREANIDSLMSDIRSQEETKPDLNLKEYLEQVALHAEVDELNENADKVHLLTLHNAKGLEFPVVFMMCMEEGVFPHHSSRDLPEELEEERRLAYVGMTRSMDKLYFTGAKRRMVFGKWGFNPVSRFLVEVPRELFQEGHSLNLPFRNSSWEKLSGKSEQASGYSSDSEEPPQLSQTSNFPEEGASGPESRFAPNNQNPGKLKFGFALKAKTPSNEAIQQGVPATMTNLKPGSVVYHQVFGVGKVISLEGDKLPDFRLSIEFKNCGKKNFLLQYTNLRVINTQHHQEVKPC